MATSTSSWYDIWQGINAVAYMCLKQTHVGGKAFKIGKQQPCKLTQLKPGALFHYAGSLSTMTIELLAETPRAGLANATLLNASSTEEDLLTVPAGAQNFSSEEALYMI